MEKSIIRDPLFLQKKALPASHSDAGCARDLLDTLRANADRCVGLAANMIGENKAIIAVHLDFMDVVFYNPVIVRKERPYSAEEGCLSLDGVRPVTRYEEIEITYQDLLWKSHRQIFTGWNAQIIQHEIDHLQGILI